MGEVLKSETRKRINDNVRLDMWTLRLENSVFLILFGRNIVMLLSKHAKSKPGKTRNRIHSFQNYLLKNGDSILQNNNNIKSSHILFVEDTLYQNNPGNFTLKRWK